MSNILQEELIKLSEMEFYNYLNWYENNYEDKFVTKELFKFQLPVHL